MTPSLDHIQLAIPRGGEAAARAFWCDLIGLVEIEKPEVLKARGGCWFQLNGAELHLGVEDPFRPAQKAHPGFQVQNLTALADMLTAANHPTTPDTDLTDRNRFFTTDPFGNRLEFIEYT